MALSDDIRRSLESYGVVREDYDEFHEARGYEQQVEQLLAHIGRATKKSFVLVGESGVGKTVILREVFRRLTSEGWGIAETSTAEIMRGTTYLGEWQTRLTNLAHYAAVDNDVLLYVTDIHNLRGAGRSSKSEENMAEALVPFLEREEVILIGEATPEAFRRGVERSPSLLRHLTAFQVSPASREDTRKFIEYAFETLRDEFLEETGVVLELPATTLTNLEHLGGIYFSGTAQPGAAIDLLRKVVEAKRTELDESNQAPRSNSIELTQRDIVGTLHKISGLPVHLLDDGIPLDLKEVREFFDARIIGQNEAVNTVIDVITLVKAGLTDPGKPTSIMLFAGPTGVGKTELAKALAEFLFGSPDRMIRCDMSEYKDYHSYEKFVGRKEAEDDTVSLVSQVRRQPFSVILLDEVEKANSNIFDVLLQAFDDGRLTDSDGNTSDLTQTIIIMTSNLGSDLSALPPMGFDAPPPDSSETVTRALQAFFRPEFLNRIDHIVRFQPLLREHIRTLAKRELGKALLRNGLVRRALRVTVDPEVHDLLAERGYDSKYGARPLRRQVEKLAVLPVAKEIIGLDGENRGSLLRLSVREGKIAVQILEDRQTRTARRISKGIAVEDPVDGARKKIRPSDLLAALEAFGQRIGDLKLRCETEEIEEKKSDLLSLSAEADFWDDQARAREVLSDIYRLERLLDAVAHTDRQQDSLLRRWEHLKKNPAEGALRQLAMDVRSLGDYLELVAFALECQDRNERRDAFLVIRLVDEAAESDLVFKLADAYRNWARRKRYGFRIVHEEEAAKTCLREVVVEISGPAAFGIFRGEEGEHEFVFGKTSRHPKRNRFVSVRVLRTPADAEPADLRIRKKAAKSPSRFGEPIRTRVAADDPASKRSVEVTCPLQGDEADDVAAALLAAEIEHARETASANGPVVVRKYTMSPTASIKDHRVPRLDISPRSFWKGEIDDLLHAVIVTRERPTEAHATSS